LVRGWRGYCGRNAFLHKKGRDARLMSFQVKKKDPESPHWGKVGGDSPGIGCSQGKTKKNMNEKLAELQPKRNALTKQDLEGFSNPEEGTEFGV